MAALLCRHVVRPRNAVRAGMSHLLRRGARRHICRWVCGPRDFRTTLMSAAHEFMLLPSGLGAVWRVRAVILCRW